MKRTPRKPELLAALAAGGFNAPHTTPKANLVCCVAAMHLMAIGADPRLTVPGTSYEWEPEKDLPEIPRLRPAIPAREEMLPPIASAAPSLDVKSAAPHAAPTVILAGWSGTATEPEPTPEPAPAGWDKIEPTPAPMSTVDIRHRLAHPAIPSTTDLRARLASRHG